MYRSRKTLKMMVAISMSVSRLRMVVWVEVTLWLELKPELEPRTQFSEVVRAFLMLMLMLLGLVREIGTDGGVVEDDERF